MSIKYEDKFLDFSLKCSSSMALERAHHFLQAAEYSLQPAILVDEDGTLALDLRVNSKVELFIELSPDNQMNAVAFHNPSQSLIDMRDWDESDLIALISQVYHEVI